MQAHVTAKDWPHWDMCTQLLSLVWQPVHYKGGNTVVPMCWHLPYTPPLLKETLHGPLGYVQRTTAKWDKSFCLWTTCMPGCVSVSTVADSLGFGIDLWRTKLLYWTLMNPVRVIVFILCLYIESWKLHSYHNNSCKHTWVLVYK